MMNADARWSFLAVPLLGVLGCSDPVPPPNQGAVTLTVSPSSAPISGKSCPTGTTYQVGSPNLALCPNNPTGAPTAACPGGSLISGTNGSSITCSVTGSGDGPYTFSGSLSATSATGDPISITFSGGTVGKNTDGTATVAVGAPPLPASGLSSANCTIKVLQEAVKGGSIWASFDCLQVTGMEAQYLCGAKGQVVFENCAGS